MKNYTFPDIMTEEEEKQNSICVFKKIPNNEKLSLNVTSKINEKSSLLHSYINNLPLSRTKNKPLLSIKDNRPINNAKIGTYRKSLHQNINNCTSLHKNTISNSLNKKIFCGSLIYLAYKELEPNANSRFYFKQRETLMSSNNFQIGNDISIILPKKYNNFCFNKSYRHTSNSNKKNNTINSTSNHLNSTTNDLHTMTNTGIDSNHMQTISYTTTNKNKPMNLKQQISKPKSNPSKVIKEFPSIRNTSPPSSSLLNNSNDTLTKIKLKLKKEQRLKFNRNIYDQMNQLNTGREQNEKRLFEIIDQSQIREEPVNLTIRNDLEQIFDIKLKTKPKVGETKKAILQAIKINTMKNNIMDETKSRMIELSDRINKICDEEALMYAGRITEEYYRNNKQMINQSIHTITNLKDFAQKKRSSENQRKRIQLNQHKISYLKNKMIQDNRRFIHELENKNDYL